MATARVMEEVSHERMAQHKKFGKQDWPNGTCEPMDHANLQHARDAYTESLAAGTLSWREILTEEVAEVYAERNAARLKAELVQVAAVAIAWVECLDRHYDWEQTAKHSEQLNITILPKADPED
jgi:hypothetical protein